MLAQKHNAEGDELQWAFAAILGESADVAL